MQSSLLLLISNGPCFAVACVWLVPALVIAVRRRGTPSLDDVSDVAPEDAPLVSVILPARNERAHIVACVEAMRRTTWPRVEIVVVDDHSTDGTGQLARATANGDARVRVIDAPDLPHGWFGKQWACEVGAAAASGSLLLFTDADTRHSPDLLTRLVSVRAERKAELMSIAGRQDMITVWEQAVQPLVFTMILLRYGSTYHIEHAVRASDVIANGQCFMLSRTAYDAVGRHAAVREYVAEDMMMAQAVWTNGGRISLVVGIEQLRTRMYTGLGSLMRGWGKNMYAGGRYAVRGGAVGRMLYPLVLPLVPLFMLAPFVSLAIAVARTVAGASSMSLLLCSTLASLGVVTTFAQANRLNRAPLYRALLAPLGALVVLIICLTAVWRGRRVQWKERNYRAA